MVIDKSNNSLPSVSLEFISESQNARPKKKGGPYSKQERHQRRQKVFQLHFEHGYPALKISEILKINRNTVNSDIKYWYLKLGKEWNAYSIESWFVKQMQRLETQRARLYEQLGSLSSLQDKLAVEHLIFDIDAKIAQLESKMMGSQDQLVQKSVEILNKEAKQKKLDVGFVSSGQIISVSQKTREAIESLIRKDRT